MGFCVEFLLGWLSLLLYWVSGSDLSGKGDGVSLLLSRLHLSLGGGGGGGLFLLCSIHGYPWFGELR